MDRTDSSVAALINWKDVSRLEAVFREHRFGRAIRRIREAQEINQEEAAECCGLHRTY